MIDRAFTKALPKAELHAHLTGSISRNTLHQIWQHKKSQSQNELQSAAIDLDDPLTAIVPGDTFVNITTFFPLFDKYIYALVNDIPSIQFATEAVIQDFLADGVAYLELRTTPRSNPSTGLTAEVYVQTVNDVVAEANRKYEGRIEVNLILSIDRKMTPTQAETVVDLAIKHIHPARLPCPSHQNTTPSKPVTTQGYVVGVDLCGNPSKGDVSLYMPAFRRAKTAGLGVTVHFAEIAASSTPSELRTLLSWAPERLGHVIHVPEDVKQVLKERKLGLELCLSCNVQAGMTVGGLGGHHFGEWRNSCCPVALSTDDVGVFGSPLSNEYFLAAKHFDLGERDMVDLARQAASVAFAGGERLVGLIDRFEDGLRTWSRGDFEAMRCGK